MYEHVLPSLLSYKKSLQVTHGATVLHRKDKLSPGFSGLKTFSLWILLGDFIFFLQSCSSGSLTPLSLHLQYSALMFSSLISKQLHSDPVSML